MKKFKFSADITAVTIVVFIVCIVLVSVMLMQFRTIEQTDITEIENMRESELRTALSEWKTRYEEIATQLEDVKTRINEYNKTIEDNDIVLAVSDLETDELDDQIFVPMYYTKEDSNLYIVPFVKYIFAVRINRGIDFDWELYKSMYNSSKDLMWDEYGEE